MSRTQISIRNRTGRSQPTLNLKENEESRQQLSEDGATIDMHVSQFCHSRMTHRAAGADHSFH